jgi:hypothetical protein
MANFFGVQRNRARLNANYLQKGIVLLESLCTHRQMDQRPNKHSVVQVGLTPLLMASIFWALTLTVCPELHEWAHPDADQEDHDCAVTLFASGGIHFAAIDLLDVGKPSHWLQVAVPLFSPQVLASTQTERLVPGRGPPYSR